MAPKTYSAIKPREAFGKMSGTVRTDTAKKILQNGWITDARCKGEYSDDYARDAARDFGKGGVTSEYVASKIPFCSKVWVEADPEGESQSLIVYANHFSYEVDLDTEQVEFSF